MSYRCLIGAVALTALWMSIGVARAADDAKYPDLSGQWNRFNVPGLAGQPSHDPTKPWGPGQQAPLTVEYQKVLEDSMADQAKGGLGNYPTARITGRRGRRPWRGRWAITGHCAPFRMTCRLV
jgi:hypothetical protein